MAAARLRADLFTLPSGKPLPMSRADAVAAIERAKAAGAGWAGAGEGIGSSGTSKGGKADKEEDEAHTRSVAHATARKAKQLLLATHGGDAASSGGVDEPTMPSPLEFEKDDDSNGHLDFVAAARWVR